MSIKAYKVPAEYIGTHVEILAEIRQRELSGVRSARVGDAWHTIREEADKLLTELEVRPCE